MKISEYLTIKKAAEFLGVSENTLRNWHKHKSLMPYIHPNGKYRLYKLEDLEKFLKRKKFDEKEIWDPLKEQE